MSEIFTPEYLLKYIYNETTAIENAMIYAALESEKELYQLYIELKEGLAILDKVKCNFCSLEKEEIVF